MSEQVNTDIADTYTDPESSVNSIMNAQDVPIMNHND